jgi:hypothetical protein
MNKVDAFHDALYARLPGAAAQWIDRNIHPASRRPLAYTFSAVFVAAIYRLVLHGPALRLGHLPGDFYYQSSNVVVSAPIFSCVLFSVGMNVLARVLRGY